MTNSDILVLLEADLDIINPDATRLAQLNHLIGVAEAAIAREGVTFSQPYTIEEGHLVVMYAAYLFRKRKSDEGMPRMLRWALNNRIISEKMQEPAPEAEEEPAEEPEVIFVDT